MTLDIIAIHSTTYSFPFSMSYTLHVDFNSVVLTVTKVIQDRSSLPVIDKESFSCAKCGAIGYLIKNIKPTISPHEVSIDVGLQHLKWLLAVEISLLEESVKRKNGPVVSVSNRSALQHYVHENALKIMLSTFLHALFNPAYLDYAIE